MIWDLKNYEIQHSLIEVSRLGSKIKDEAMHLKKLKSLTLNHKAMFERVFNTSFDEVELGILTVDPSSYPYFQKEEVIMSELIPLKHSFMIS